MRRYTATYMIWITLIVSQPLTESYFALAWCSESNGIIQLSIYGVMVNDYSAGLLAKERGHGRFGSFKHYINLED